MLKVVGASWWQTRISTYILVAVALIGIGAILLSEFGRVENDGTYSASVFWKRTTGYRIDFWGQANKLPSIPLGVARAYYKTGIIETGWSLLEIETSSDYPDDVQAYAAGLLEGSLTWQLIYHHWYNTVRAACLPRASLCKKMRKFLKENTINTKENAENFRHEDPYWHMVHLFYAQLNGLETGWKFAVQKSRQNFQIESEDFLWLAMASDLPDLENASNNITNGKNIGSHGFILLKSFIRNEFEPLIALVHETSAPYARMLRLIKRYKFSYHVLPDSDTRIVPGRSIVMTSYPGALSSQDENYLINGKEKEIFVVGTPLIVANHSLWKHVRVKDQVMSPARIMAANRLSIDGYHWAELLKRQNSGTSNRQWIHINSRINDISIIEQIPGHTEYIEFSSKFKKTGYQALTGSPISLSIRKIIGTDVNDQHNLNTNKLLQNNVTNIDELKNLMFSEDIAYRGDLDEKPRPFGIIDAKLMLFDFDGLESFTATSGPPISFDDNEEDENNVISSTEEEINLNLLREPFDWSKTFPNSSHKGHPQKFEFQPVNPTWVWI